MARTLPLGNPSDAITDAPTATSAPLAGLVAIYDPAMCCATGVCGPSVDPALLALTRDIRWLEKQGVTVQRYGLSQEPQAFVQEPRVTGLMQAFGDKALPATLVDGEVLMFGRYPTRAELIDALSARADVPEDSQAGDGGGCCAPGSGCC
jgi:hypothetical protein